MESDFILNWLDIKAAFQSIGNRSLVESATLVIRNHQPSMPGIISKKDPRALNQPLYQLSHLAWGRGSSRRMDVNWNA